MLFPHPARESGGLEADCSGSDVNIVSCLCRKLTGLLENNKQADVRQ